LIGTLCLANAVRHARQAYLVTAGGGRRADCAGQ
jgi:hypothetical protein